MKNKIRKQNYVKIMSKIIIITIFIFLLLIGFIMVYLISGYIVKETERFTKEEIEYVSVAISAATEAIIGSAFASINKTRKFAIKIYHTAELKLYKFISLSKRNNWRKNRYIYNFNSERIILYSSQSRAIQNFFESLKNYSRNLLYVK